MNSAPLLFLGIFATLASSFWGLLLVPQLQLGRQGQATNSVTFALYPQNRGGSAKAGAEVYRSLGCVECHSQQVRGLGTDVARGWGARNTVAQDYLGDYPVLLGAQRVGPDLANIGLRKTNRVELLNHLYSPQITAPGSMMPPYRFLFERRDFGPGKKPSGDALAPNIAGNDSSYEMVPSAEALALTDYLMSLRAEDALYEAPYLKPGAHPAQSTSTNSMGTNSILTNASATSNPAPTSPSTAPAK